LWQWLADWIANWALMNGTLVGWLLGFGSLILFVALLVHFLVALLLIIPTWRICSRAGFSGALSLLHLVPVIGSFIVMAILAFSTWPAGEATQERR
jgi:uncharacterized membrane protein YhaH (DUF805 family)